MMHYSKGENVEREIRKEDLPFEDCWVNGKPDFLWMHVKGGTKVNNVVSYAKNALDKGEYRTIVWTGVGGGIVKTVSCAEIIKRTHPLNQVTRMSYTNIEEHWLPQMEGLDEIIVNRKIPCIHILMTLDEIDESVNGVQKPNAPLRLTEEATKTLFSSNRNAKRFQGSGNGGSQQQHNQNRNQSTSNKEQPKRKKSNYQREKHDNKGKERQQNNSRTQRPQKEQVEVGTKRDQTQETSEHVPSEGNSTNM